MAKRIKNLSDSEILERKEKRREKADLDKKRYHEFYAKAAMPPEEWAVVQAKKKGKLKRA